MIRLQPGHTISQGIPGKAASVTIEVPNIWKAPEELPDSEVLSCPADELEQRRIDGALSAAYESTARQIGETIAGRLSEPWHAQPDFHLMDLQQQKALHHLVAIDLLNRGL